MADEIKNEGLKWGRVAGLLMSLVVASLSGVGDKFFAHAENGLWLISFIFFLGGYVVFLPFFVIFRAQEKLTLKEAIAEAKRIFGSNVQSTRDENGKAIFPDELKTLALSLFVYYILASFVGNFVINYLGIVVLGI